MTLIDTNIAIRLRDGDAEATSRIAALPELPKLSVLSRVELEGGIHARPERHEQRRIFLDMLLQRFEFLGFDAPCAEAYRHVVEACGFSRPRILDRMIAATAIVHDLTLVTTNTPDFRDIPGLKLEIWPA